MAIPAPEPVFTPSNPTNPNKGYSVSGGAEGVQDWWIHLQTVDIMYVRRNLYNADTSSALTAPTVTSNYLDVVCTVQTQNEVIENVAFSSADSSSGNLFQAQVLQIQSTAASGGFGEQGAVSTSSMGVIRRPVRTDAAGNYLDPTGVCTQTVNLQVDQIPGVFEPSYDTSNTVNSILAQIMGQVSQSCPTFKATLVDL